MFAILHVLWIFGVDIFKSRRRLEAENLFLHHQLNIAPALWLELVGRPTDLLSILAMPVRPEGRHLIATQVSHNLPADACSLLGVILFIKFVGFLCEQNQSYNE